MKKSFLSSYGLCALLAVGVLYGCKKDKDKETQSNRILGIWNVTRETEITKNKTTGKYSDTSYSVTFAPGLVTAEFRDNGKFYFNINTSSPSKDTLNWHFHNDSTLMMDDELFHVSNFTSNRLTTTLYYWDNTDSVKSILEYSK